MADWILQSLRMINLHQNQWSLFHRLEKENLRRRKKERSFSPIYLASTMWKRTAIGFANFIL